MRYLCIILIVVCFCTSDAIAYKDKTTHKKLTEQTFRLVASDLLEMRAFRQLIVDGSVAEDEGINFLNHFYDPVTEKGLPKNSYTLAFETRMKRPATGLGSTYPTALEWAYDGMPQDKDNDWVGAIKAYGEGGLEDLKRAYTALGHVLHLLQDLGQPDHAKARPHPGDGLMDEYPDALIGYCAVTTATYVAANKVGYEGLWGLESASWPAGSAIIEGFEMKEMFRGLALLAQREEADLDLPMDGEVSLGLGPCTNAIMADRPTADENWRRFESKIPAVPLIPLNPDDERFKRHHALGTKLLPQIEEYGAGLLLHFYEIVNPPPYVEEVEITQRGVPKYKRTWSGDTGKARSASTTGNSPLEPGVEATVKIRVGPRRPDPDVANAEMRERLSSSSVTVMIETASGTSSLKRLHEEGDLQFRRGGIWVGTFEPKQSGTLVIEAKDLDRHYLPRQPLGNELDRDPSSRARAQSSPGYPWLGYEPGADRNHSFTVAPPCANLDLEKLRYGTWIGTYSRKVEGGRGELIIGGRGEWTSTETEEGSIKFRSLVNPCKPHFMSFGRGSGAYKWKKTFKSTERYVLSPDKSEGENKESAGGVNAKGSISFKEGKGSVRLFSFHPVVNARNTGRCELLSFSGSEEGTTWNIRYEGEAKPEHGDLCADPCDSEDAGFLSGYVQSISGVVGPTLSTLAMQQKVKEVSAIQQWLVNLIQLGSSPALALGSEIPYGCQQADKLWVDEDPAYAAKVSELRENIRRYRTARRATAARAADITNRMAGVLQEAAPHTAAALRDLARTLAAVQE